MNRSKTSITIERTLDGFVELGAEGRPLYTDNKQADYRLVNDRFDSWELHWVNLAGMGLTLIVGVYPTSWPDVSVCIMTDDRADAERRRLLTEGYELMTPRFEPATLPPVRPAVQAMLDQWAEEQREAEEAAEKQEGRKNHTIKKPNK